MCPFFSIQVPAPLRGNAIEQVSVAVAFAIYMFIFTIVKIIAGVHWIFHQHLNSEKKFSQVEYEFTYTNFGGNSSELLIQY